MRINTEHMRGAESLAKDQQRTQRRRIGSHQKLLIIRYSSLRTEGSKCALYGVISASGFEGVAAGGVLGVYSYCDPTILPRKRFRISS